VGVDHGGAEFLVPEQFLYRPDIIAVLQKVCCEAVAECMGTDVFVDIASFCSAFDCFVDAALVDMMSFVCLRIWVKTALF